MTQKASEISGCHPDELITSKAPSQDVLNWMDIAERYALYKAEQACRKQRELCADHAKTMQMKVPTEHPIYGILRIQKTVVDRDSIRNAPLATESKK